MENLIGELFLYLMIRMSGRKHLANAVPRLEELRAAPEKVLADCPIRIGPLKLYRMVGVALLFFLLLGYTYWLFWRQGLGWLEASLVAALCFALVGGIWKWLPMLRYEIFIYRVGIELKDGPTSVWCPWALFKAPGSGFVHPEKHLCPNIYLPVVPSAISMVVQRFDEKTVAQGMGVKTAQFSFESADQAAIICSYEVFADELLELLLELSHQLAEPLDGTGPKTEESLPVTVTGWIEVPLSRLAFPPLCCGCETPTSDQIRGEFGQGQRLEFDLPFCSTCRADLQRRKWRGGIIGLAAAAISAALVIVPFLFLFHVDGGFLDDIIRFFLFVIFLAVLCLGWLAGRGFAYRRGLPVQVRYWFGTRMKIRFCRPQYAARFLEAVHLTKDGG